MTRHWAGFLLLGIFFLAALFRFTGVNWDAGNHLHPDERFLTLLQLDLKMPEHFSDYLDPNISTLNPTNQGIGFMVYGALPVVVNKVISQWFNTDTYDSANLQGRVLAGLADLLTLLFLYRLVRLLEPKIVPKNTALWASFLYAIAVLPIQLSHFYATDSFLVLCMTASIFYAFQWLKNPRPKFLVWLAIWFGLALACKITALFVLPLLLAIMFLDFLRKPVLLNHVLEFGGRVLSWLILVYCCVRVANPGYFASANWLDPSLSPAFISSVAALKAMTTTEAWYPPSVQWLHKTPVLFALQNFALYSVGLPWFGLLLAGAWSFGQKHLVELRHKKYTWLGLAALLLFGWAAAYFLYQSVQFAKNMRYFAPLIPVYALLAGYGAVWIIQKLHRFNAAGVALILGCLIWPLAFFSIYLHPHSRVQATQWIYDRLPDRSVIATEYWDDGLPLLLPLEKHFIGKEIAVFDPDTNEKWQKINQAFGQSDYYILSSNRGWGSIPTAPERYPQMTEYYQKLFAGETEWQLIKTFTSYPSLQYLGIPIEFNTDSADESFTVYDHPKVMIFARKTKIDTLTQREK